MCTKGRYPLDAAHPARTPPSRPGSRPGRVGAHPPPARRIPGALAGGVGANSTGGRRCCAPVAQTDPLYPDKPPTAPPARPNPAGPPMVRRGSYRPSMGTWSAIALGRTGRDVPRFGAGEGMPRRSYGGYRSSHRRRTRPQRTERTVRRPGRPCSTSCSELMWSSGNGTSR